MASVLKVRYTTASHAYMTILGYTAQASNDNSSMAKSKKKKTPDNTIVENRKARFDYAMEEHFEAGLVLEGWEVKSLREKRVQIQDSYVFIKDNEAWLSNCNITPLATASTHIHPEQTRVRKLLLQRREIDKLIGAVDRKGYSIVATRMYWKRGRAKLDIALAKGKKAHDKRADSKDRDWQREKGRIMKHG